MRCGGRFSPASQGSTQQDSRHCFFSRKLACCKGGRRALAMLTAQRQSIRLLQTVLAAAVAVPALLFCFAAWQAYKNDEGVAEDQIEQSLDGRREPADEVGE